MDLSKKLVNLGAFSFVASLIIAIVTFVALKKLDPSDNPLMEKISLIRLSMQADMMHDAIRGDVLESLLKKSSNDSSSTSMDALKDHSTTIKNAINEVVEVTKNNNLNKDSVEASENIDKYVASAETIILSSNLEEANKKYSSEFIASFDLLEESLEKLGEKIEEEANLEKTQTISTAFWLRIVVGVLSIISVLAIGWYTRSTAKSVRAAFAKIIDNLNKQVRVLSHSAHNFSQTANSLAQGSHEEAAATHESLSAINSIKELIKSSSEETALSLYEIQKTKDTAQSGNIKVEVMAKAMNGITTANDSLKEIVEIIKQISKEASVINDIVSKTQLLSFNASIEAARAGQHGRGFAVVAEEVGNLAETSGQAASKIHQLLAESQNKVQEIVSTNQNKVEEGTEICAEVNSLFKSIDEQVRLVNNTVSNLKQSSDIQNQSVEQISTSIEQLSALSKTNAEFAHKSLTGVELLKESSDSLVSLSKDISQIIFGKGTIKQEAKQSSIPLDENNGRSSRHHSSKVLSRVRDLKDTDTTNSDFVPFQ